MFIETEFTLCTSLLSLQLWRDTSWASSLSWERAIFSSSLTASLPVMVTVDAMMNEQWQQWQQQCQSSSVSICYRESHLLLSLLPLLFFSLSLKQEANFAVVVDYFTFGRLPWLCCDVVMRQRRCIPCPFLLVVVVMVVHVVIRILFFLPSSL